MLVVAEDPDRGAARDMGPAQRGERLGNLAVRRDHARAAATFLTGVHVKKTEGTDLQAGISMDQIAARELGWTDVALECLPEMNVPGSLQRCLRILMHVNTTKSPRDLVHVYLRDARALRPDLAAQAVAQTAGDGSGSAGN